MAAPGKWYYLPDLQNADVSLIYIYLFLLVFTPTWLVRSLSEYVLQRSINLPLACCMPLVAYLCKHNNTAVNQI